jgi:hypothetical protein
MKNSAKQSKYFLWIITLLLLAIIFERAFVGSNSWRYTHWLFNYDVEFVKRGLAGQLLLITNYDTNFSNLEPIWKSITWIALLLFTFVVARSFLSINQIKSNLLLFILAISSSATLQHFIYDFGRFDTVNLIISMIALLSINKLSDKALYLIIPFLCSVMILVHEASFFLFTPVIMSYWLYKSPKNILGKGIVFISILVLTYLVSTKGLIQTLSLKEHQMILEEKYGTNISASSLNVLHRDLKDNIKFTANSIDKKRVYDHIAFFITFLPLFIVLGKIISAIAQHAKTKKLFFLLVLSCVTPLALYPLGEDHFRWWAVGITNIFLIISLLTYQSQSITNDVIKVCELNKKLIITSIVLSLVLGPLGNPSAYPFTLNQYFIEALNL